MEGNKYIKEINIKKVKPLYNRVVTTMRKYEHPVEEQSNTLITKQAGTLREVQVVIAVGDSVKNLKEGDLVHINPARYAVHRHEEGSIKNGVIGDNPVIKYNFPTVLIEKTPHLLLFDNDIDYKIEDYEDEVVEEDAPNPLILPPTKQF